MNATIITNLSLATYPVKEDYQLIDDSLFGVVTDAIIVFIESYESNVFLQTPTWRMIFIDSVNNLDSLWVDLSDNVNDRLIKSLRFKT